MGGQQTLTREEERRLLDDRNSILRLLGDPPEETGLPPKF
jgi:hypothetical protein